MQVMNNGPIISESTKGKNFPLWLNAARPAVGNLPLQLRVWLEVEVELEVENICYNAVTILFNIDLINCTNTISIKLKLEQLSLTQSAS